MSNRFQRGSLLRESRKDSPDVWVFRFYEDNEGKRKYRRQIIGTVAEFPTQRDAEKAVAALRSNINVEVQVPQTVTELISHYPEYELSRKAYSSRKNHKVLTRLYVEPHWGNIFRLYVPSRLRNGWMNSHSRQPPRLR